MDPLKLWKPSWEEAWDAQALQDAKAFPLKTLSHLPQMPGITPETKKWLKGKSLWYLVRHDTKRVLPRYFFKHPFLYTFRFFKSLLRKKSYLRDDDFFLYGCKRVEDFEKLLQDPQSLLVVGFSYCHKPLECPSQRFTSDCIHDRNNPICRQCFIGKAMHALPSDKVISLVIPTIHYIGEKMFEIVEQYPHRNILFLITACEMTLEMFGDWANMINIRGIGVRLDGRICNTMKAFALSEKGVKPGLTVVLNHSQRRILDLLKIV